MAAWKCKECTTVFTVGAPRCPTITCQARNAFEVGDESEANVYDLPEWQPVQQTPAEDEVAERLGDVLPARKTETVELPAELDGTGEQLPDAVEGDTTEREAPGVPAQKRRGQDVSS